MVLFLLIHKKIIKLPLKLVNFTQANAGVAHLVFYKRTLFNNLRKNSI